MVSENHIRIWTQIRLHVFMSITKITKEVTTIVRSDMNEDWNCHCYIFYICYIQRIVRKHTGEIDKTVCWLSLKLRIFCRKQVLNARSIPVLARCKSGGGEQKDYLTSMLLLCIYIVITGSNRTTSVPQLSWVLVRVTKIYQKLLHKYIYMVMCNTFTWTWVSPAFIQTTRSSCPLYIYIYIYIYTWFSKNYNDNCIFCL